MLNYEQVNALFIIVQNAPIKGSDAEFISNLKQTLVEMAKQLEVEEAEKKE